VNDDCVNHFDCFISVSFVSSFIGVLTIDQASSARLAEEVRVCIVKRGIV
jgi:hypothetical protein